MIVKPGTRMYFCNIGEDGGVCIGEIGQEDRWVEIESADVPQLIKRMREVMRSRRLAIAGALPQE